MKKTNKKRNVKKILLIYFGATSIICGFAGMSSSIAMGLIFIAIGALLLFLAFKKPKAKEQNQPTASAVSQPTPTVTPSAPAVTINPLYSDDKDRNLFKAVVDGHLLAYSYERDFCLIKDGTEAEKLKKLSGNGGKEIEFRKEPENEFDPNAVAIYFNNEKIGYVHKGQTQDMINDWLNKDKKPVSGYINRILLSEGKATYKVGFYKPIENFESKTFALVKSTSKERQENLGYCSEGDSIRVDEDGIVYDDVNNELGEVPQSFKTYMENNELSEAAGAISEIEIADNGKYKVTVSVYFR